MVEPLKHVLLKVVRSSQRASCELQAGALSSFMFHATDMTTSTVKGPGRYASPTDIRERKGMLAQQPHLPSHLVSWCLHFHMSTRVS